MRGDRALATVKILKNSAFLYTFLIPWGLKESERKTIKFNFITVHKYTQYLLLVGLKENKKNTERRKGDTRLPK